MQSISVSHKLQVAVVAVTRGEGQLHNVGETRLTRGWTLALIQDEADLLVIARHLEQRKCLDTPFANDVIAVDVNQDGRSRASGCRYVLDMPRSFFLTCALSRCRATNPPGTKPGWTVHVFTLSHRGEREQLTRHVLLDGRIGTRRARQEALSLFRAGRGRHRDPVAASGLNGTLRSILRG